MRQRSPFDLRYKVIPCSVADVLTFHSNRKEFIGAVPGYIIVPHLTFFLKPAGPAFTVGAAGTVQLRYNNTAKTVIVGPGLVVGALDQTTDTGGYAGAAGSALMGSEANAADAAGKSVVSGTSGNADYTGPGSPITIVILYRLIPSSVPTLLFALKNPSLR